MKARDAVTSVAPPRIAQMVLVAPALLFALMLIVQFGLLFHARNVAEQAAQEGAAAARRFDGTEAGAAEAGPASSWPTLGPETLHGPGGGREAHRRRPQR